MNNKVNFLSDNLLDLIKDNVSTDTGFNIIINIFNDIHNSYPEIDFNYLSDNDVFDFIENIMGYDDFYFKVNGFEFRFISEYVIDEKVMDFIEEDLSINIVNRSYSHFIDYFISRMDLDDYMRYFGLDYSDLIYSYNNWQEYSEGFYIFLNDKD